MKAISIVKGKAVPFPMDHVDTDQIIPAQFLTSTSRDGYGQNLFRGLRDASPEFFLNQERYKGGSILIAGSNFGCGSSREHAVWALTGAGFEAVVAKSFADIFSSNSAKNGLLLVSLSSDRVDQLLDKARSGSLELEIDLQNQAITDGEVKDSFEYDAFRKYCLLNGLDDVDYIFSKREQVEKYFLERRKSLHYDTTDIIE